MNGSTHRNIDLAPGTTGKLVTFDVGDDVLEVALLDDGVIDIVLRPVLGTEPVGSFRLTASEIVEFIRWEKSLRA